MQFCRPVPLKLDREHNTNDDLEDDNTSEVKDTEHDADWWLRGDSKEVRSSFCWLFNFKV